MRLTPSGHVDSFCRDRLPAAELWPEFRFDLPELTGYPDRLNAATELLGGTDPAAPCLLAPDTAALSYADVDARTNQLAQVLIDEGLVPGNRVLLRGPNNPWLAMSWLAVLKAGGVAVTTMAQLRSREITTIANLTEPAMAICDHRFTAELAAGAPGLPTLIYDNDEHGELARRCAQKPRSFWPIDTAADDVALLAATSGTTGQPKVTMHFHRDLLAIADTFAKCLIKPRPEDVFTGTPPLGFTYGLGGLLVFPLRAGASALLIERSTPAELADHIKRHQVSVFGTAPIAYRGLLPHAEKLTSLRRCVSAGEHLPKAVWDDFRDSTGIEIIDGIGSTEMLHIFIGSADGDIRAGSTGRTVPGYHAAILDRDGRPVPDGEPGRLAVRGPTGCRYLTDERQKTYVQDGWNITGDTYTRDGEGYFWFQARSDDMIISAGYNIAGPEVEEALLGHPDVAEVAVIGAPDPDRGNVVQAWVVLRDGVTADDGKAAELQEFAKKSIAPYKYPRSVVFTAELPKSITGKTQRYRLREQARDLHALSAARFRQVAGDLRVQADVVQRACCHRHNHRRALSAAEAVRAEVATLAGCGRADGEPDQQQHRPSAHAPIVTTTSALRQMARRDIKKAGRVESGRPFLFVVTPGAGGRLPGAPGPPAASHRWRRWPAGR